MNGPDTGLYMPMSATSTGDGDPCRQRRQGWQALLCRTKIWQVSRTAGLLLLKRLTWALGSTCKHTATCARDTV